MTTAFVNDDMLQEITRVIVEAVNPVKLILFGSYARGNANPSSDLDFLIVEEGLFDASRSRRKEIGRIHRLLRGVHVAMDILVFSQNEFDKWAPSKNHVISRAIREGRTLYERA